MTDEQDYAPLHLRTKPYLIPLYMAFQRYVETRVTADDLAAMNEWVRKFTNGTDMPPLDWVVSHIMALEKQIREYEKCPGEYIPE